MSVIGVQSQRSAALTLAKSSPRPPFPGGEERHPTGATGETHPPLRRDALAALY